MPFVTAGGHRLEYEWIGPEDRDAPVLVLLHEGLGSVAMWRDFPQALADASGLAVLVYSRWGYGQSDPVTEFPHGIDYMHTEAREGLHGVLNELGVTRPILVGHSDGASIALIYAGSGLTPAPLGLIVMAPHVFVEDVTTISIAKARVAYETTDLRAKLLRYHADPDSAFFGWNIAWLQPRFKDWNIEDVVPQVRCPIMVIQGEDDEYGTAKQIASIEAHTGGAADSALLPECGHSPHKDQRQMTLAAMLRHIAKVAAAPAEERRGGATAA